MLLKDSMFDLSKISSFQDAAVTVMGLGRFKQGSGVGAAKWLMRHGAQIVITDLKSEEELRESVDEIMYWYTQYRATIKDRDIYPPVFVLGEHHEDDFTNVNLVMQNPGVARESAFVKLAHDNGISVESDISLFFRYCPFPIISITGTRGKSTTTALLGEMLRLTDPKTVIAGNITRSPLEDLDMLLLEKKPVAIVLELSSWLLESLENVGRGPDIAILTNAFKDHLDRYDSFEHYLNAKELIFTMQKSDQKAILNADQELSNEIVARVPSEVYWFAQENITDRRGIVAQNGEINLKLDGQMITLIRQDEIALKGKHNLSNVLAASLGASLAGVPLEKIVEVLKTFAGLPNRQEIVREVEGVMYVNDTTATSPEGTMAALERFGNGGNIILITGGKGKGFTFDEMAEKIRKECKFVVYLSGSSTEDISQAVGENIPSAGADSMVGAVAEARNIAQLGDIILLSPGTASFEFFKNEFDRGDQFVAAVKAL